MQVISPRLPTEWQSFLGNSVTAFAHKVADEIYADRGHEIYPSSDMVFNAFECCPPKDTKVILLGQDPYHNPGQAMGLSFSVPLGMKIPPSLRRIFKELMVDVGQDYPFSGDLTKWANEGVLLLNAILTVEHNSPGSHKKKGWQEFTDDVIEAINNKMDNKVFLLWGAFAQKKGQLIDREKHLVLEAAHPSPLAGNKFAGNAHFSKANTYLIKNNLNPIEWKLD